MKRYEETVCYPDGERTGISFLDRGRLWPGTPLRDTVPDLKKAAGAHRLQGVSNLKKTEPRAPFFASRFAV